MNPNTEMHDALIRAYGALEWAMGALEALDATLERRIDLTFLAETISAIQSAVSYKVD